MMTARLLTSADRVKRVKPGGTAETETSRIIRLVRAFLGEPRMTRADEARWAEPVDVPGLGKVCALWLERKVESQPGYAAGYGPDEETHPRMIRVLAAANRAGYYTVQSQPGLDHPTLGVGYRRLRQRAAVQGFVQEGDFADALIAWAASRGLRVIKGKAPRRRYDYRHLVKVTWAGERPVSDFGVLFPRRHMHDDWVGFGVCSREAREALCRAWQVTLIDMRVGRDTLWADLEGFLHEWR